MLKIGDIVVCVKEVDGFTEAVGKLGVVISVAWERIQVKFENLNHTSWWYPDDTRYLVSLKENKR